MRLTDESIRRTKPPTKGQRLIWDDLVSGFGARLTPSGKVCFVVQWRETSSRKPRESLRPQWPQLTVVAARDLARKRLGEVVATQGSAGAQELRFAIRAWYERKTETNTWRPRYRLKVDALIKHYIEGQESKFVKLSAGTRQAIEDLGHKPVSAVSRSEIVRVVDGIKPGAGEQLMAILSSFYNDMLDRGVEVPNPARNRLRLLGGRRVRSRSLTESEFLKLWRALEEEGDPAHTCFAVLAFTGCRRREATQMYGAEVDLEAATWTLPPERRKTGARDPEPFVIHLHPYIVQALRQQPVLEGSPFVFWGRRDQRPFDFHYAVMQRLRALEIPDWRLHDVRRFVRSGMARLGIAQAIAELCLGHVIGSGLVKVYDTHSYSSEKSAAWQKWGDHLVQLIGLQVAHALPIRSPLPAR
jgi:integrase